MTTICEDEQSFYDRHYEKLQKTQDNSSRNGTGAAHSDLQTRRPGVVGPLDVTSAALHMMRASGNTTNNSPVTENGRKKVYIYIYICIAITSCQVFNHFIM